MSLRPLLSLALLLLLSACAEKETVTAQDAAGVQGIARPDSLLAYEHSVSIELAADALGARMAAVRSACLEGSHGRCSLIAFDESTGSYARGTVKLRLVPEGVEPLVALASREGVLAARSTRAEDLSVAVADTGRQRAQYELQQARLLELAARKDLSVADQLTLARELSTLEAQLQGAERDAAVQQLRLETNLLSLNFSVSQASESRWSTLRWPDRRPRPNSASSIPWWVPPPRCSRASSPSSRPTAKTSFTLAGPAQGIRSSC